MNTILVLGAGRSSAALINYLLEEARHHQWQIIVGDIAQAAAQARIGNHPNGTAIAFDINQPEAADRIAQAQVVISLLPATMHPQVAAHCLTHNKHLITASYVSPEMQAFHEQALSRNLLFLNECGLDPGIDHMSAMQVIDGIRSRGGVLTSFESFTGGLIAPETDPENPWRYKFTWNPRNVVMAGQGTARFLQEGQYKYIPYQQLFTRTTPIHVPGYGDYDGYANRDSLKYIDTYQLQGIKTMLRGTLRNAGYCKAWNILVQLGCCDDTYTMEGVASMRHRDFINAFLEHHASNRVEEKIINKFQLEYDGEEMKRLTWSGFFSDEPIGLTTGTPAQITEHILNKKWQLHAQDIDLIVMWHRFGYTLNGENNEIQATLVVKGDDAVRTAMAKTVGLPMGIAAKLLMTDQIQARGVTIPIDAAFYRPILTELARHGIELHEHHS